MRRLLFSILILFFLLLTNYAGAEPTVVHEDAKLTASDAAQGDQFGAFVAVSGDTVLVGARSDDANRGAAYAFVRSGTTWTQQARLSASDGTYYDQFGSSVAVSGDIAVIGARLDNSPGGYNRSGSAYVFVRNGTTWTEEGRLVAGDESSDQWFGSSVAVSGNTALVGAPKDDHGYWPTDAGSAYVFVRDGTTWTQQAQLTASDATHDARFGISLALSGDTAIVGTGSLHGESAYVFVRSGATWTEQAKLVASDAAGWTAFGYSVAVSGDTAVVGAWHDVGIFVGSAYVFVRDGLTWVEQAKLTASDGATQDRFGHNVSVSGDTILVGSLYDDHSNLADAGSAYVFVRDGTDWSERAKLTPSDAAAGDLFGISVMVSDYTAVVGAQWDDHSGGDNTGSAYVFNLSVVIAIDIKPGSYPNSINPRSNGVIPVAILGSDTFDVTEIDVTTLAFGAWDRAPHHDLTDTWVYNEHLEDVNMDGFVDLVSHYRTRYTGIMCGDTEVTLTGELLDGRPFEGADEIMTVGCPPPERAKPVSDPEATTVAPATESSVFGKDE